MSTTKQITDQVGYIGQGWVGKHSADAIEVLGTPVVRYSLEPEYIGNKDKIKDCSLVFIVVTAPTTPEGFDDSHIRDAISVTAPGTLVAIRSTLPPGTIAAYQNEFSDRVFVFYPEFLTMSSAKEDAEHPKRNIIGLGEKATTEDAERILAVIPKAPYTKVTTAINAELSKYLTNCYWNVRNMYINMQYDLATALGGEWDDLRDMFVHDERLQYLHTHPVHGGGRGAGNSCLVKDFAVFVEQYKAHVGDKRGVAILENIVNKNVQYLHKSGKQLEFIEQVYGKDYLKKLGMHDQ